MQNGKTPAGHVLIVEDDESTRSLLRTIVSRIHLRSVEAADGRSGLGLLDAFSFRAVLLDLLLPEVSGLEILAWLHVTRPVMLTRVIVITAALEPAWRSAPEVKRARTLIAKPFDLLEVERELLACCEMESPR